MEDLWSASPRRKGEVASYWPKDEAYFSNHLSRQLHATLMGVVVNREVEITPTIVEKGTGERVDLLVQATCPQTHRAWHVVIEAKACWNPDLEIDLDRQLRGRYLGPGDFRCGIYLVGWYECSQWTPDSRRDVTRRLDKAQVESTLSEQANRACTGGRQVRLKVLDMSLGKTASSKSEPG